MGQPKHRWTPDLHDLKVWQGAVNDAGTMAWVHGMRYDPVSSIVQTGEWIAANHKLISASSELADLVGRLADMPCPGSPDEQVHAIRVTEGMLREAQALLARIHGTQQDRKEG